MRLRSLIAVTANASCVGLLSAVAYGLVDAHSSSAWAQMVSLASLSMSLMSGSTISVAEPSSLAILASALAAGSFAIARVRSKKRTND